MLTLGVAHRAETFERIREPLAARDIAVEHVSVRERTTRLDDPPVDRSTVDVGFVFPGRVMEGGVLASLLGVPWVNDREAVLRSRNKAETLARLDQAGLPVPETVLVSNPIENPEALEDTFHDLGSPVVVKPNSTTRGTGVLKVEDPDSLRGGTDFLDLIHEFPATGDRSYLLQEYVPAARDIRVMLIDGSYAGAVERRLPESARDAGRWKHNVHAGAEARAITPDPSIQERAERAAAVMDIPFLGVDLLATEDRVLVTETNARPTVDTADKYVDDFYDRLASLIETTAHARDG